MHFKLSYMGGTTQDVTLNDLKKALEDNIERLLGIEKIVNDATVASEIARPRDPDEVLRLVIWAATT